MSQKVILMEIRMFFLHAYLHLTLRLHFNIVVYFGAAILLIATNMLTCAELNFINVGKFYDCVVKRYVQKQTFFHPKLV